MMGLASADTGAPRHAVIVPGHAIFQDGRWYGGFYGDDRFYEQHVRDGVTLHDSLDSSVIVFSGGRTRPDHEAVRSGGVTNAEGEGMLEYAKQYCPALRNSIAETFARDSFENVLFSLLAFRHHLGEWPASVHLVSWPFKALRFYLIACGLGLADGRFAFHGSGDLDSQSDLEIVAAENAAYDSEIVWIRRTDARILDPLHRSQSFANKRLRRMPAVYESNSDYMEAVKQAYTGGPAGAIIETVESTGAHGRWREATWPWQP